MKHISEYRDKDKAQALAAGIEKAAAGRELTFMEVCGTHTMAIARFGIREILPKNLRLISGPGCPVCVTPNNFLDHALALSRLPNVTICTFGDMMRVPGSTTSLEKEHAEGRDIRIVYSTLDAIDIAKKNPAREIVFLGIGFETTTPTVAAAIQKAKTENIKNFSVLSANKTVPQALAALLDGPVALDGFLLPGHVSTIIGANAYRKLLEEKKVAGVIAGFEPTDILEAILELATIEVGSLHTSYARAVTNEGNIKALSVMNEVFEPCDAIWRGIGEIPQSGLKIRSQFSAFDASKKFAVTIEETREPHGCRCGEILTGKILPNSCPLFGKACTPENPVGACMVSTEGTCAAYYKYTLRR